MAFIIAVISMSCISTSLPSHSFSNTSCQSPPHLPKFANNKTNDSSEGSLLVYSMLEQAYSDNHLAAAWLLNVSMQVPPYCHHHVHIMAKAGLMVLRRTGLAGIQRNDTAAEELGRDVVVYLRDCVSGSTYRVDSMLLCAIMIKKTYNIDVNVSLLSSG